MKKLTFATVLILLIFGNFATVKANSEPQKIALNMIEAITKNDFENARKDFDVTMLNALSVQQFQMFWAQFQMMHGKFVTISDFSETQEVENFIMVFNKIIFEQNTLKLRTVIVQNKETNKLEITGFFIDKVEKTECYIYLDAKYVDKSKFSELEIALPPDAILQGRLTIPTNIPANQKIPAVVLVHGSGPQDFDVTISKNKVFRDIAYGLSSNGIAVLRYDKRTLVDKNIDVQNLTINEETVFDAVEAVKFLRENFSHIIGNIYVLGHSLGGFAMPRIANTSNDAAGFIVVAGNSRDLGDVLIEQFEYLASLNKQEEKTDEEKNSIDSIKNVEIEKVKRFQNKDFDENTSSDFLPLGMPAKYLLDLKNYNPVKEFSNEKRPILFLQGARDYQVTVEDFEIWNKELGKNSNTTFILFDDLNHLLQSGVGKSTPSEYLAKKNVAQEVIDAIVKWIFSEK